MARPDHCQGCVCILPMICPREIFCRSSVRIREFADGRRCQWRRFSSRSRLFDLGTTSFITELLSMLDRFHRRGAVVDFDGAFETVGRRRRQELAVVCDDRIYQCLRRTAEDNDNESRHKKTTSEEQRGQLLLPFFSIGVGCVDGGRGAG